MVSKTALLAANVFILIASGRLAAQDRSLRLEVDDSSAKPEAAQVRLMTPDDGYLMLLHVAGGSVRVMFPVKAGGASAIPGGDYTLDRLGIKMPYANGSRSGIMVAAWSPTPIRTGEFVRYGHWAVNDLDRESFRTDPAAASIDLVTRLGATPGEVVAVEYGAGGSVASRMPVTSRPDPNAARDSYYWKVVRNLIRIQGVARCGSGTRDVTGAGDTCVAPSPLRSAPKPRAEPEPVYVPPRPLQNPAASRPAPSPPPASRPATPPPSERRPTKPQL